MTAYLLLSLLAQPAPVPPPPSEPSVVTEQITQLRAYSCAAGPDQKWQVTFESAFRSPVANALPQKYLSGPDARYDFDGVAVYIHGPMNIIGNPNNRPKCLMRLSRDASGGSRNGTVIDGVRMTGATTDSLLRNEGLEVCAYRSCHFEQTGGGYAVVLDNSRLPGATDAPENRVNATNSGHTFADCTIVGGVLLRGCVTEVEFRNCWFTGGKPIYIEDAPDEPNRDNKPRRITFHNCLSESSESRRIILRGVERSEVTLTGWSAGQFIVE